MDKKRGKIVCRCEEVSEEEIREAIRNGARTLTDVKRRTRAGMGLCQGRTCSKIITRILMQELGIGPDEIELSTDRPPVRPLSFGELGSDKDE